MAIMDLRVDSKKVERILEALVGATTDSPHQKELLSILRTEGPGSGLGYLIDNAIRRIEEQSRNSDSWDVIRIPHTNQPY